MKNYKKIRWLIISISGFFLLLDQFLKWQATHNWQEPKFIYQHFGWQPFLNQGIAFSLPIPNWLTIIFTIPIIIIISSLIKAEYNNISRYSAWSIILSGALSNLIDRLIFHYVIDYLAFFTAAINLADVLIVGGLLIYLINNHFKKKLTKDNINTYL